MDLTQAKFLLDENVPRKLKKVFKSKGLDCQTVQELRWREVKNGELSVKVKRNDFILVTRDKDFVFLWKKYKLKVIYFAVKPATLKFLQPRLNDTLNSWTYDLNSSFLVMIQNKEIRFWKL